MAEGKYIKKGYSRWRKGVRDGFDRNGGVECKPCFEKKLEIDRLRAENQRLKQKLKRVEEIRVKGYFGNQTPSSKKPYKRNASAENQQRKGGARPGHAGHGRRSHEIDQADEVIDLEKPRACPECRLVLSDRDTRERSVVDASGSMKAKRIVYRCKRGACPGCGKVYSRKPQALPKTLYGNALVAQAAAQHYVYGTTLGKLEQMLGSELVSSSSLIDAFHRLGRVCEKALPALIERYRQAPVKHADETGWRTDGHSGWAWIFCSDDTTILHFTNTRGRRIVEEILGETPLPGVLVVDRLAAYNRAPCKIQYCFAHLLREVQKVAEEFALNLEVKAFTEELEPLVSDAMTLRRYARGEREYSSRAREIKSRIQALMAKPAKHEGVKHLQEIFTKRERRMYHWAADRRVPAENNRAEREIRPTVIARKVSFGSQSQRGARTRSAIMSVLWTARKRAKDKPPDELLRDLLNRITEDPKTSVADWLNSLGTSTPGN